MHDLVASECRNCANFRYVFSEDGPLWEWGYCALEREGKPVVGAAVGTQIEAEVEAGDRARLVEGGFGLYKLEADDGCDLFTPHPDLDDHADDDHEERPKVGRGGI